MRRLLLLIALVVPASARADFDLVGAHLASAHVRGGYEAATVGLYARGDDGLTVGALRNSERRLSFYAGRTWQTSDGRWAITVGAISGYRAAVVSPLVVPSVQLPLGTATAVRLSLIPKPRAGGSAAAHLSLEWRP
jgi:hypothetical protein